MNKRTELLMPAGSLERLKVAVLYGADAIYMGTPDLSLRTKSNFTLEEVMEGIAFAHEKGKRVYLTLNLFSHNKDIAKLPEFVETIQKVKPDGVIVADPGVFAFVRERAPEIDLHVSTQANVCSWLSVKFWQDMGAKLVVLGREVTFEELKEIRGKCPDIRLETFIHGAMCMTYSGRCLLSNFLAERGANQGNCANACRWKYKVHVKRKDGTLEDIEIDEENKKNFDFFLEEEQRPGDFMAIEEDERGSYILNSKDLCLMPHLDKYLALGIDSLKVEGRGRSAYYVAVTARTYRRAIDAWRNDPEAWSPEPYLRELQTIPNRGYTMAFHSGKLTELAHHYEDTRTLSSWEFAGMITHTTEDAFFVAVKNRIEKGDVLEFLPHDGGEPLLLRIYEFDDVTNRRRTTDEGINAGQKPVIRIPFAWFHEETADTLQKRFPPYTVLRKAHVMAEGEWRRLKLDQMSIKAEQGKISQEDYEAFRASLQDEGPGKATRAPKLGIEGCCGRGCNGCAHFWHDERFAKAREKHRSKKIGELLTSEEAAGAKE